MHACMQIMAEYGIDLIRTWGFLNGAQDALAKGVALQPSVSVASIARRCLQYVAVTGQALGHPA